MDGPQRLIIADDEQDTVQVCVKNILLHSKGNYIPLVAYDGYDAIDLLKKNDVAAIILDINMRNLDGVEVCREMMKDTRLQGVPVIISSGCLNPEIRHTLEDMGVKHFLTKPYPMHSLLNLIKDVLAEPHPTSQSRIKSL